MKICSIFTTSVYKSINRSLFLEQTTMGSTGSKIVKKIVSPFSSSPVIGDYSEPDTNQKPSLEKELVARKASKASNSPVILKRQG